MDKSLTSLRQQKFKLLKSQRLLKPSDFRQVFDANNNRCLTQGRLADGRQFKIHQANFLLFVKVGRDKKDQSRLGLAITKKRVKRAHERNRVKRLTREYFRLHQHRLIWPVDMVLTVKLSPEPLENSLIFDQLQEAFYLVNQRLQRLGNLDGKASVK